MTKSNTGRAAEFKGHCQVCGSLQKLPKGVMSLHGYNVTYGFFSGVCHGAKSLPFEKACNLVAASVERAKSSLANLEAFQARLRTKATTPFAVVSVRVKDGQYRSHYEWQRVEVKMEFKPFSGDESGRGYNVFFTGEKYDYISNKIDTGKSTLLETVTDLNTQYANWLETEAKNLRNYIKWQSERVANWKEADLIPVDVKRDKLGFVPAEPTYQMVDKVRAAEAAE